MKKSTFWFKLGAYAMLVNRGASYDRPLQQCRAR